MHKSTTLNIEQTSHSIRSDRVRDRNSYNYAQRIRQMIKMGLERLADRGFKIGSAC